MAFKGQDHRAVFRKGYFRKGVILDGCGGRVSMFFGRRDTDESITGLNVAFKIAFVKFHYLGHVKRFVYFRAKRFQRAFSCLDIFDKQIVHQKPYDIVYDSCHHRKKNGENKGLIGRKLRKVPGIE